MSTRSAVLKIMLVAIALTAVIGIAAVFTQSTVAWRLLATSVVVIFATCAMLPVVSSERDARLDALAWTCMSYVGFGAALIIGLVWADGFFIGGPLEEATWSWFGAGVPALAIALPALKRRRRDDTSLQFAESIAIWGAGGVFLATILTALASRLGFRAGEVAAIFLPITACASCAAIGLRQAASRSLDAPAAASTTERRIARIGLGASLLASAVGVLFLLYEQVTQLPIAFGGWEPFIIAITLLGGIAAAAGASNLLALSRATGFFRWLRHIAAATIFALAIVISVEIAVPSTPWFVERLLWSLVIVAGSSLLAGVIAMRVTRAKPVAADPIDQLTWRCPRCETLATIPLGEHACIRCGLAVILTLRDDRCPACAYDLHALPASTKCCPECGRERQLPSDLGRFLEQRETVTPVDRS